MICWPPDTAIVTGLKYETYLNNYMPYIAFLVQGSIFLVGMGPGYFSH